MATPAEIEDFMHGPLVIWLRSCLKNPDKLHDYEDLADGPLIHEVYLLIDPEPLHHEVVPSVRNAAQRVRNMSCIVKNIKTLYKEEFCQVVVSLPDVIRLGREPDSKGGLEDMQLLLLLLIGCAVQCPNKEKFIENIRTLPQEAQLALVNNICRVTESQEIVLTHDSYPESEDLLVSHIKRLADERDKYLSLWTEQEEVRQSSSGSASSSSMSNENQHLGVELALCKSQMRKQRQELEEKLEKNIELKNEVEHNKVIIAGLKTKMRELTQQTRDLKLYRDEVDTLREKAEKCNRLENDVTIYRDKLIDLQYLKDRVDDLIKENKILEENTMLLEGQLAKARKREDHILELEKTKMQQQQCINDLNLEVEAQSERIQQIQEENLQLSLLNKSNMLNSSSLSNPMDDSLINTGAGDNSLLEQLTNSAHTRLLELELENRRLVADNETLQESLRCQNNEQILELEKEKKKLSLQVQSLESSKKKLTQLNSDYEKSLNEQKLETKKTLESKEMLLTQLLARSKEIDDLNNERQKLERKVEELEESLEVVRQQADSITELQELTNKISVLDKNILRLRETNEEKDVLIDKLTAEAEANLKEKNSFKKQVEELNQQLSKLHEMEQEYRELKSKYNIDKETLATLQQDLVNEKMDRQKLRNSLDKLGLAIEQLEDPDFAFDRILSNPEILKVLKERMSENNLDTNATNLSNAKLEVSIKTLQTQINSLKAEHLALQLANSQLAAEKDEILKELGKFRDNNERLLKDQKSLQKLHEQLASDNDELLETLGTSKNANNDLRTENRNLKDKIMVWESNQQTLEAEKEALSLESKTLTNLRAEHSKLTEDFRHLFTENKKLKSENRVLQEEYKLLRTDNGKLRLSLTELEGQIASMKDIMTSLEVEKTKLQNKCEVFIQSNDKLEVDKRTLMEHVSLILGQYNDLLNHSLEDKEHHHSEEKIFADKVNNLRRQNEKLEEKIMQSYRQMNSVTSNRTRNPIGAFVQKVKKASSELISKSRKSVEEGARRGTDSDTSLEDVRLRQGDTLSYLGTPGTRRAVYCSADENNSGSNEPDEGVKPSGEDENQRSSTPQPDPGKRLIRSIKPSNYFSLAGFLSIMFTKKLSLFVYNHVSVINKSPSRSPNLSHHSSKKSSPSEDKNSPLWYEYGCV